MAAGKKVQDDVVARINLNGNDLDVFYIGGSKFGIHIPNNPKINTFPKSALDKMIQSKQAIIQNQARWNEICASILPDGSTKTHTADGERKSAQAQALGALMDENYIERDANGVLRISDKDDDSKDVRNPNKKKSSLSPEEAARILASDKPVAKGVASGQKSDFSDDEFEDDYDDEYDELDGVPTRQNDNRRTNGRRRRQNPRGEYDNSDDYEEYEQQGMQGSVTPTIMPPPSDVREKQERAMRGDLNGDGVIDEFDTFIAEEQKKNGLVMVVFFGGIIVSILLFFFVHGCTASLFRGESFQIIPDFGATQTTTQQQQQADTNQEAMQEQPNDEQVELETVVRSDFDPETAVSTFPMATESEQSIATNFMRKVREFIIARDLEKFHEAVNIGMIADQFAIAYADTAREAQGLSDDEYNELRDYYGGVLVERENQHVAIGDTYGSIFGGRIREVRRDPIDPNRLYIVTESIGGDHHRICLILQGEVPEDGGDTRWEINGLMDPIGYARMIQKGAATSDSR